MKTKIPSILPVCIAILSSVLTSDANPAETPSIEEEKGYHFFVGANLRIPYEDTYFPVERIWNARAHIKVKDEIVVQRVSGIKEIKVDRQAKISPHFVRISDLNCEPEYSVGRDPRTQAARQQITSQSIASAFSDDADSIYRHSASPSAFMQIPDVGLATDAHMGGMEGNPDGEVSSNTSASSMPSLAEMQKMVQVESNLSMAESFEFAADPNDFDTSPSRPMWDMLHVKFSINSDEYFPSGHLVFIFQLAEESEGEPVMSWFHFLSLTDISPEAKSYNYRLPAYPDGMHIASKEVFLFTNGSEIATNLSSKQVEMKKKDARVFLKYQYLAENSGKTRPPDRAWKYLEPFLRNKINSEIRNESITLKIDSDGLVQDIVTSPEVQSAFNSRDIQEIASLIYLPALENGKPVPGELTFSLKDVILD